MALSIEVDDVLAFDVALRALDTTLDRIKAFLLEFRGSDTSDPFWMGLKSICEKTQMNLIENQNGFEWRLK